jgi:WD40 repeat protein
VLLWDAATGQLREEQPLKHVGSVTALSITPDVRTLAAAAWDPRVLLWDLRDARENAMELDRHLGPVRAARVCLSCGVCLCSCALVLTRACPGECLSHSVVSGDRF